MTPSIHALDTDVLSYIFHISTETIGYVEDLPQKDSSNLSFNPLFQARRLSQVCSGWRATILDMPILWGRLIILNSLFDPQWRAEVLKRSATAPLAIRGSFVIDDDTIQYSRPCILETVKENWARVETLDLDFIEDDPFSDEDTGKPMFENTFVSQIYEDIFYRPAPALRSLSLQVYFDTPFHLTKAALLEDREFLGNAPLLRNVHLSCMGIPPRPQWFTNIRRLSLKECAQIGRERSSARGVDVPTLCEWLRYTTALEFLSLENCVITTDGPLLGNQNGGLLQAPIFLPCLRSLNIKAQTDEFNILMPTLLQIQLHPLSNLKIDLSKPTVFEGSWGPAQVAEAINLAMRFFQQHSDFFRTPGSDVRRRTLAPEWEKQAAIECLFLRVNFGLFKLILLPLQASHDTSSPLSFSLTDAKGQEIVPGRHDVELDSDGQTHHASPSLSLLGPYRSFLSGLTSCHLESVKHLIWDVDLNIKVLREGMYDLATEALRGVETLETDVRRIWQLNKLQVWMGQRRAGAPDRNNYLQEPNQHEFTGLRDKRGANNTMFPSLRHLVFKPFEPEPRSELARDMGIHKWAFVYGVSKENAEKRNRSALVEFIRWRIQAGVDEDDEDRSKLADNNIGEGKHRYKPIASIHLGQLSDCVEMFGGSGAFLEDSGFNGIEFIWSCRNDKGREDRDNKDSVDVHYKCGGEDDSAKLEFR